MGMIYVVGTGPGNSDNITDYAKNAIKSCDIIMGYSYYTDLIKSMLEGKKVISGGVTDEFKRAEEAIKYANNGYKVAVISSGDPAIYGMAGIILEMVAAHNYNTEIKIVPGITAINSAASLIGAPLMNDFCSISLSDKLTPENVILKRLEAAAMGDFVTGLYNPVSKNRKNMIVMAQEIFMKYRNGSTPVGIIKNAYRDGQKVILSTLDSFLNEEIDMFTILIIGNSESYRFNDFIISPRNYSNKYNI